MTGLPDALDRLAAALASQLGASRDTTVHAITHTLVPYRRWRDALELESAEDYELALVRLLSGERGYAEASPGVRGHCADELLNPSPDVAVYRAYLAESVRLHHAPAVAVAAPRPSTSASVSRSSLSVPQPEPAVPVPTARSLTAEELDGRCRYCSKDLPPGRRLVFCPHCGQNLTTLRCPACSTELELGWKFCVTCGRGLAGSSA